MSASDQSIRPADHRFRFLLGLVILVVSVAVLIAVRFNGAINRSDMAVVASQGAAVFGGSADNRTSWLVAENRNIQSPFVAASAVNGAVSVAAGARAESALRLVAVLWALFAATGLYAWARAHQIARLPSAMLCALLLCDPFLNSSMAHGRVDAAAFGWLFWSLAFAARALSEQQAALRSSLLSAGALALALLSWPTIATALPLLAIEYLFHPATATVRQRIRCSVITFATAGILAALVFWGISLWLPHALSDLQLLMHVEQRQGFHSGALLLLAQMWVFGSPLLTLLATVAWLTGRIRLAFLVVAAVIGIALVSTSLYAHRALYLLPIMLQIIVHSLPKWRDRQQLWLLGLLCAGGIAGLAMRSFPDRLPTSDDEAGLIQRVQASGCSRIIDYSGDLYFVARAQGWSSWTGLGFLTDPTQRTLLFQRFASLDRYLEYLIEQTGACAVVISDPNDWLMQPSWQVPVEHLGPWCADGHALAAPVVIASDRLLPTRPFGAFRVFSRSQCTQP